MHYHRFVRLAAVVVTPLALVGIGATPAFSAGTTAGGTIHVWQSDTEDSATVPNSGHGRDWRLWQLD